MQQQKELIQRLIGYISASLKGNCYTITDRIYSSLCKEYLSSIDNEDYQKIVPTHSVMGVKIKKYDYLRVGIFICDTVLEYSQNIDDIDSSQNIDIPVYALYEQDESIGICIDIKDSIPQLDLFVLDVEQYNSQIKKEDLFVTVVKKPQLQKLLGYVTAIEGAILICETDLIRVCEEFEEGDSQIIVPPDDSFPGYRAGVIVKTPLDVNRYETEYPVFAEYERGCIQKIFIDYQQKRNIKTFTAREMEKIALL